MAGNSHMKSGIGRRFFTDRREGKLMHKDINTKREREAAARHVLDV